MREQRQAAVCLQSWWRCSLPGLRGSYEHGRHGIGGGADACQYAWLAVIHGGRLSQDAFQLYQLFDEDITSCDGFAYTARAVLNYMEELRGCSVLIRQRHSRQFTYGFHERQRSLPPDDAGKFRALTGSPRRHEFQDVGCALTVIRSDGVHDAGRGHGGSVYINQCDGSALRLNQVD